MGAMVMPFVHEATAMPLDVVLSGSGLEESFLDRAREVELGGIPVPVIEISDLVVAKVLAGRPKDLENAAALTRLHARGLDVDRIRTTLGSVERALGQGGFLPAFERRLS
jgi:hypothetical protein